MSVARGKADTEGWRIAPQPGHAKASGAAQWRLSQQSRSHETILAYVDANGRNHRWGRPLRQSCVPFRVLCSRIGATAYNAAGPSH